MQIKNWDKIEDGDVEHWRNRLTGEEVVLEGAEGEWEVWNKYRNEALDAVMPQLDKVFDSKAEAHKKAVAYLENNTGGDLEVRSIEDIIGNKLHEKTARHPKDSWGVRHDKKNEAVDDWEETPVIKKDVYDDNVVIYVNVYHFLTSLLENDEASAKLNKMFQLYLQHSDENYLQAMYSFVGSDNAVNTANQDDVLTQPLQFITFDAQESNPTGFIEPKEDTEIYDENYVLLQIHQGGDTRGGYTRPIVLKIRDVDSFHLGMRDINAETTDEDGERIVWYSDNAGYDWHEGDGQGKENWEFRPDENEVIYAPSGEPITFFPSF